MEWASRSAAGAARSAASATAQLAASARRGERAAADRSAAALAAALRDLQPPLRAAAALHPTDRAITSVHAHYGYVRHSVFYTYPKCPVGHELLDWTYHMWDVMSGWG